MRDSRRLQPLPQPLSAELPAAAKYCTWVHTSQAPPSRSVRVYFPLCRLLAAGSLASGRDGVGVGLAPQCFQGGGADKRLGGEASQFSRLLEPASPYPWFLLPHRPQG